MDAAQSTLAAKSAASPSVERSAQETLPTKSPPFPIVTAFGNVYGFASSKEEAIAVGNAPFVNDVVDVYLANNVALGDGSRVATAWVACPAPLTDIGCVRLVLDIRHELATLNIEELVIRCRRAVEEAIGGRRVFSCIDRRLEQPSGRRATSPLAAEVDRDRERRSSDRRSRGSKECRRRSACLLWIDGVPSIRF
jgi:hypothetical protein